VSRFTPAGVAASRVGSDDDVLPMTPRLNRNIARGLLVVSYPLRMTAHLTQRP
jgi:hypothetical protein